MRGSRTRSRVAAVIGLLAFLALLLGSVQRVAVAAGTPRFLMLPFDASEKIAIQRAWWTRGSTGAFDLLHHAIDYVNGKRDDINNWKTFPVLAAAAGEACGAKTAQSGCIDTGEIMGNRVLIKHEVDGVTYYTFYNHLDTINPDIPLDNKNRTVHVNAGEEIGTAGESNSQGLLHLHWELLDANFKPLDPYGIKGITDEYPDPKGKNGNEVGKNNYFLTDPPVGFNAKVKPTPTPEGSPDPSASAQPTPTPGTGVPSPSGDGGNPSASPSQVAVVTTPPPGDGGTSGSPLAGMDLVPIAVVMGVVVVGVVLLGLVAITRRMRRSTLPRDQNWHP